MIKRGVLLVFLILLPLVNAGSIGISPVHFELFFEPNLERTFDFTVSNADPKGAIEVYALGDLAKYVKLSDDSFVGEGSLRVYLKLPKTIEIPGNHRILIGARESSSENGASGGVAGIAAIQASIDVMVQYPGKYIEAAFNVNNVNKGENASFDLTVNNLGTESINISPVIEVYEDNIKLLTKNIEIGKMLSKDKRVINDFLATSSLNEGTYNTSLVINYGREIRISRELKIGYMFVNITDYSYNFSSGKINPFRISVENLWNSEMKNVYAEIVITDKGKVLTSFKTPSMDMAPWEKKDLVGFFDVSDIPEGRYTANLQVFYDSKINNKLVAVYVFKPPVNNVWMIWVGIAAGFVLVVIVVFVYLIVKIRRLKNESGKKNKR
ncbi:MAG: hypothetical protein WCP89_02960 [archaeon]